MPTIKNWSKNRVMTLTNQENNPKVIKFIGSNKSLIIGFTILFSKSQTTLAIRMTWKVFFTENPGNMLKLR